jgi:hypothetical protein
MAAMENNIVMSRLIEPADLDGGRQTVKIKSVERGAREMEVVTTDGRRLEIDGRAVGTLTPMLGRDFARWAGRELVVSIDGTVRGGLDMTAKPEERPRSNHPGVVIIDPDARAKVAGRISNWLSASFNK